MACKELTLDTKGSCFLCQTRAPTPASSPTKIDESTGTTEKCHLTVQNHGNICRLLKINPYSVLIKTIGHGDDSTKAAISFGEFLVNLEGNSTKCDFSASLCETCYPVASKLASLSHELEMIIMRTRDQLQKFHGILSAPPAQEDPEASQLKGNAEVETKLIENLREEMEHKSHSYLRRDSTESPTTCQTSFDTDPHDSNATIEEYRKRVRTPSSENPNEYHHVNRKMSHLSKKLRRNTPSPSLSTDKASPASTESVDTQINIGGPQDDHEDPPVLDLSHYKCLKIGDRCQCPFCGDLFSPSVSLEDGIDYHLVITHLHKIYCSKNVTNSPAPAFQQLCQQVLHQVIRPSSMAMQNDSGKTEMLIYSCSECNNIYKTANWATFHFILDHFKAFEDKLISAQQDNQHLVFNQQTLQFHNSVPVHKQHVDKQNFSVYPTPTTKSNPPMDNLFHDLINLPSDESSNSDHSQRSDYPHSLQPTPSTTPHPRPSSESTSSLNEIHGNITGDKIQCTFCKAMFGAGKSSSSAIRLHVACFHPEKLFSASKLPEINEAIFFELCRDVIKNELRAAQINSGGGPSNNILLCSNCNKTFTRMHNLKYHCVNSHFDAMAEKLVRLQEDYLEDKSSALARQAEFKPSQLETCGLPSMSSSTSQEPQQQHWQTFVAEDQSKSTETTSGSNIPTTVAGTTYTTESMQFPNFSFSSTSGGGVVGGTYSSSTSSNPTNEIIWSKSSMPTAPPPAHQIKTEGLYYQSSIQYPATATTLSDSQQVYNPTWLPPPTPQMQSQSYYHATPQPSSYQYQLLNQSYYDMAINQVSHHGPSPTWLRLPHPDNDEQNYKHDQMEAMKQEKSSNNFQSNSVSPSPPPIPHYLGNVRNEFIQQTNQDHHDNCPDISVDHTEEIN